MLIKYLKIIFFSCYISRVFCDNIIYLKNNNELITQGNTATTKIYYIFKNSNQTLNCLPNISDMFKLSFSFSLHWYFNDKRLFKFDNKLIVNVKMNSEYDAGVYLCSIKGVENEKFVTHISKFILRFALFPIRYFQINFSFMIKQQCEYVNKKLLSTEVIKIIYIFILCSECCYLSKRFS